jgi:hypothetical protein
MSCLWKGRSCLAYTFYSLFHRLHFEKLLQGMTMAILVLKMDKSFLLYKRQI